MLTLIVVVVSVGFADSINPSTVGPALYLASYRDGGRSLAGFIVGVFAVSALAGVVLVLGPGRLLVADRPAPHSEHLIEVAAGMVLAVVATGLWLVRSRVAARVAQNERLVGRASILVGAAIMAIELPTALPYFAVIAAVAGSGRSPLTQVILIFAFNLMFVAPLVGVWSVCRLAGRGGLDWLARRREALERHAAEVVPALVFVVAVILVGIGGSGLAGD